MKNNVLMDKSFAFAIRVVNMYKYLCEEKKEFVLSKQVLRSGTSIGANCREAKRGQSDADFVSKLSIALKEADETQYWLELLFMTDFLSQELYESICADCEELIKLLVSIIKTSKSKKQNS